MTDKITLSNLANLQNETTAVNTINNNNATIVAAIDNTLSRDGTSPNQMSAALDMNSNHILNLPKPTSNFDAVRLIDLSTSPNPGITVSPLPAGGTSGQFLYKNSSTNFDVTWKSFNWINPLDAPYNCKFDGVTDDTAGLRAALLAAAGKVLILPQGAIALTDPILISPSFIQKANFTNGSAVITNLTSTAGMYVGASVQPFSKTDLCNTTSGLPTVTNMFFGTTYLAVGMTVTGTGIPASTTISSIDSISQITLSNNATATNTQITLSFISTGIPFTTVKSVDSATQITLNASCTASGTQEWIFVTNNNIPRAIVGNGATLKARAASSSPLLTVENVHTSYNDFRIDGPLVLDANNLHAYPLRIHGGQHMYLNNLECLNGTTGGVWFAGEPGYGIYSNTFSDIRSASNAGTGIIIKSTNNQTQNFYGGNNLIGISTQSNTGYGFDIDYANVAIVNSECELNGLGGVNIAHTIQCDISGTHIEANPTTAGAIALIGMDNINSVGVRVKGGRTIGTISSFLLSSPSNSFDTADANGTPIIWHGGVNFQGGGLGFGSSLGVADTINSFNSLKFSILGTNIATFSSAGIQLASTGGLGVGGAGPVAGSINGPATGFGILIAGSTKAVFTQGLVMGSPTGGDKGLGTVNATGLFVNGSALLASSRLINTTAPLAGGGDLSADRTLSITGAAGQVLAGSTPAFTATPTLGVAGTTLGTLSLTGNTSGTILITPQATAGSPTLTLPNTTGTFAVGASAPLALSTTTGNLTITGAAGQVLAGSTPAFTATPTLGVAGTTVGTLAFANATSGTITLSPVTGALGTVTLSLPAVTDTLAGKALANGGTNAALTASNGGIVYSTASALAILAGTATANLPLLSAASTTPAWAAITYPTSATSGGIPYFSSTTAMASSAVMTTNGVMYGGGAGAAPQVTAQGGNNTVLAANSGAPAFSASPTIGTSVTTPLIIGGTAVNSTLELRATSGVGIGAESVSITTGSNGATPAFFAQRNSGDSGKSYIGLNINAPASSLDIRLSATDPFIDQYRAGMTVRTGNGSGSAGLAFINDGGAGVGTSAVIQLVANNVTPGLRSCAAMSSSVQDTAVATFSSDYKIETYASGTFAGRLYVSKSGGVNIGGSNNVGLNNLQGQGSILSASSSGGIGYTTGAGSTVTQITSRTTGVTINAVVGAITLVSAAGSATAASFTVTNSAVAATDVIHVCQKSGTDLYEIFVTNVAAGSFKITFFTTGGTTTEQPVFNFAVIKGVTA